MPFFYTTLTLETIFSVFHCSVIYFLIRQRMIVGKNVYKSLFYTYYIMNAIIGQLYVISYLIGWILPHFSIIRQYYQKYEWLHITPFLTATFFQFCNITTYTVMTINRYRVLSRVNTLRASWSPAVTIGVRFLTFVIPLGLILLRLPFRLTFQIDGEMTFFTYDNYPEKVLIPMTDIILVLFNLTVLVALSMKSAKLYKKLHPQDNHNNGNHEAKLIKNEDKLFLHAIFAIICLVIKLLNDICNLFGQIYGLYALIEMVQAQLIASIHCLGGSIFFLIISKNARTGYFKFYKPVKSQTNNPGRSTRIFVSQNYKISSQ